MCLVLCRFCDVHLHLVIGSYHFHIVLRVLNVCVAVCEHLFVYLATILVLLEAELQVRPPLCLLRYSLVRVCVLSCCQHLLALLSAHRHGLQPTGSCTTRSEERRVGKECVSTCSSRWSPYHEKTN